MRHVTSRSMILAQLAGVVLAAVAAACGGGSGSGSGGSSGGGTVTSTSRIAWDQPAANAAELATFRFVMYVDGVRTELPAASCSTPAGSAGFPCLSSLPAMSAGQHTIELACYVVAGSVFESPKSAPLVITVSGSSATIAGSVTAGSQTVARSAAAPATAREVVTRAGLRLTIEVIAESDRPSALAVSEDGVVFFAGRSGVVRMVRGGTIAGEPVDLEGAADAVLDIVLDPQFATSHLVYVLDTTPGPASTFRLSRYREAGGQLGERAVMFDDVPASPVGPSASLAFGPDGRLYVALDDGGDTESARRGGSYNGKVLRLNADGSTPHDMPGASPIYASSLRAPRGLAWDASTASLWVADAGARRAQRIRARGGRGIDVTAFRLPLAAGPASIAVYRASLIPAWQGSLLVAPAEEAGYLLRAQVNDADRGTIASSERLEIPGAAFVRVVEVGPDGAIYVGTDREVLRIVPR